MSPSYWGPSTWIFMHTLAAKIKEESYSVVGKDLILLLINISNHLPCPECTQHAKEFWRKVNIDTLKTKKDLINILYIFHNIVNKRRKTPCFKYDDLQIYNEKDVITTHNLFSRNFHTRGNMNLINESFHRSKVLRYIKKWLMTNIRHFAPPN